MSGVYDVALNERNIDLDEASYDASASDANFAYVPKGEPPSARKFKIGDAEHVKIAVSAFVNWSFRGNAPDIPVSAKSGMRSKISAAIHKYLKGDEAKYYSKWLSTGKKPASELRMSEMYIVAPRYSGNDEARFPEVPSASGVDTALLTAGDPNPVYVVRPLAILDEVSENGLVYNKAIFDGVYEQVLSKHPVARRGHISESDKSSSFPPDDGYWIGATIDSSVYGKPTVFGKCYVVPGETRDMVLRRRAAGVGLSNSLWGDVTEAEDEHGNMQPVAVRIESIDFVPEERAALQALGGNFRIVSESKEGNDMNDNDADDKKRVLKETMSLATAEDIYEALGDNAHHVTAMHIKAGKCAECTPGAMREMLSGETRRHVAETHLSEEVTAEETYKMLKEETRRVVAELYAKERGMRMTPEEEGRIRESAISEMKTTYDKQLSEMAQQVKDLQETNRRFEREKFERLLSEAIDSKFNHLVLSTEDGKRKINSLKSTLRMRSVAEMAGSTKVDDIDPAVTRAYDSEEFKPLAEMTIASLAGPSAFTGLNNNSTVPDKNQNFGFDPKTGRYDAEQAKRARDIANW